MLLNVVDGDVFHEIQVLLYLANHRPQRGLNTTKELLLKNSLLGHSTPVGPCSQDGQTCKEPLLCPFLIWPKTLPTTMETAWSNDGDSPSFGYRANLPRSSNTRADSHGGPHPQINREGTRPKVARGSSHVPRTFRALQWKNMWKRHFSRYYA